MLRCVGEGEITWSFTFSKADYLEASIKVASFIVENIPSHKIKPRKRAARKWEITVKGHEGYDEKEESSVLVVLKLLQALTLLTMQFSVVVHIKHKFTVFYCLY